MLGAMASRRDRHQAHLAAVAALGKTLARRAKSCCELCEASGRLSVTEVPGGPEDPSEDWALLVCERCASVATGEVARLRLRDDERDTLRFLTNAMWSEVRPAQIAAVRALRGLDVPWATEALEGLWLDEAVEALI